MKTSWSGRAAPLAFNPPPKPIALAVALALTAPHAVLAAPVGHTVVAGDVTLTQPNAQTMVIHQTSDKAILNWRGFSIAAGETVQFVQPGSSSVALNRVTGGAPSEIFGRLEANGKVFLVNPAGVMFGKTASVDVGALVASTLGIGDADFLAGRYAFADGGEHAGAVRNEGRLAAAGRGTIALLGAQVSNHGTVTARLGTVGLAAGGQVTLDFNGDGLTRVVVDAARINALVENGGAIISDGGQVTMTARALDAIADTVVRQGGLVQASALVERNGRIVLDGGSQGKLELAGKIDASGRAAGARGGEVTLLGRDIALAAGAAIDASGAAGGGSVLVGGDYQGANPLVPHAASTTMAAGATIHADALGDGAGGTVVLWSDGHTRAHGSVSATGGAQGGNGGMVETSGRTLDVAGMRVAAGAARGSGGTWLLDPGDIYIDSDLAASIAQALSNSTNVTVSTAAADNDGAGDIYVGASIDKTAGADSTLLLEADRNITVGPDVRIASSGIAGALHVDFSADVDAISGGAVALLAGSSVLSNGGNVRIYGRDNPATGFASGSPGLDDGVLLQGATLDTRRGQSDAGASGSISIAGAGRSFADEYGWSSTEGVGVRIDNANLLATTGGIRIDGTGGTYAPDQQTLTDSRGLVIGLAGGARIATGSGTLALSASSGRASGDEGGVAGLYARLSGGSSISTTGGAMQLNGLARRGAGIDIALFGAAISAGGALSMTSLLSPTSAPGAGGITLALDKALLTAGGDLSLTGSGGVRAGVELSAYSSTIRAASVSFDGTGSAGAGGIAASIRGGIIEATNGALEFDGTGGGSRAGVHLETRSASIGATGGHVLISGTGGDWGGSGVVIESYDDQTGVDGSAGSNGIMSSSSTLLYADRGDLSVAGINGTGGVMAAGAITDAASSSAAGVRLAGVELLATDGNILIAGAGKADTSIAATGVALTNVVASTLARPGNPAQGSVRIAGVSSGATPGVSLDGVTLGGEGMSGNIIIGGRIAGTGPVLGYPGTSQWANTVRTIGTINLRPDDGNYDYGGVPALALPISVGEGGSGFNVSFAALGIGAGPETTVVVGSEEHSGQITYLDPAPFAGHLTLQNGGAGSQGIVLGASAQVSAQLTLSSGGTVSAPGTAITTADLLLHGTQPEANFVLDSAGNSVGRLTVHFDLPASPARPEYGDVTFQNTGALLVGGLRSGGFTTDGNRPTAIAGNNTVAGDLLLRTSGQLTLAQHVRTLGGDITMVTGAALDTAGHGLAPGGSGGWRVFADTWAGENRSGLTPSLPHPNYYNCAYGASCGAAIAGNRFIYRAQPTLTLTPHQLSRPYGAANPALTFTPAGLLNGDTLADALSGGYTTAAQPSSGVGVYSIAGAFSSPVGYAIDAGQGTLHIDRAALLIAVDDKSKVYGDTDPLPSATFAGLVADDSALVVTGLTLAAPTGAAATAGTHAIVGANATAANYAISYRPGTLTVARAPLLVVADDKAKVYGAPDPVLSAAMSGFRYGDTAAAVQGLMLSAPSGAAAAAGSHPIMAQGGAAANYALSYQPGVLAVDQAVLTYVADPTRLLVGSGTPIQGSVTGFVYSDTVASATGGTLEFVALAPAPPTPGVYPVEGRGLTAANYRFVQAPSNASALTTLPTVIFDRPTLARNITFESSNVYEKNFGSPRLCVGLGPLGSGSASSEGNDPLALEWSRVRLSPNLSNCLGLGQRNSCQDF